MRYDERMRSRLVHALVLVASVALAGTAGCDDGIAAGPADGGPETGPEVDGGPTPALYGLDSRPTNPTCLAPARPPGNPPLKFVRRWANVYLPLPMRMAQIPGDPSRVFVALRDGRVVSFPTVNPPNTPTTVLTMPRSVNTGGEGGLLGLAFHPKFSATGHVYLSYTTTGGSSGMRSVVARMTSVDQGVSFAAPTYLDIVPPFDQPFVNHKGGDAHFGRDGYLYLAFGDGGSGGDPLNNGQSTTSFLSKILRIDVDKPSGGRAYGIPSGNPFAASGGEPETYAYGFRNPFRFSIDNETDQVWVADVGEAKWEELDKVQVGGNYGWRFREAMHCYQPSTNCPKNGLIDPVWEYDHGQGVAIVGAPVYRGKAIPSLVGKVVVGDYGSSRVWVLSDQADGTWAQTEISDLGGGANWVAFDVDLDGEIYGVSVNGGIYELVSAAPEPPSVFPDRLSKTGCVDPSDPKRAASGLIPFSPISPLWSDGAEKERFLAIPDGTHITLGVDGDFDFPNGSVLMKHFRLGQKLIETRLFVRHGDGGWAGYTYEWDDAQTDATLLPANKTRAMGSTSWYYPSRSECLRCHTGAAGGALGPEVSQLNSNFVYEKTNRTSNQLRTLEHIGMFDKPLSAPVDQLPALSAPAGIGAVEARARSYLHANCSSCHRPLGGGGDLDLRYSTPLSATNACAIGPQSGDLGVVGAKIVAPGDPAKSILVQRPRRTDSYRMPPVGTNVVDPLGTTLLDQWVQGLASCPLAAADAGSE